MQKSMFTSRGTLHVDGLEALLDHACRLLGVKDAMDCGQNWNRASGYLLCSAGSGFTAAYLHTILSAFTQHQQLLE